MRHKLHDKPYSKSTLETWRSGIGCVLYVVDKCRSQLVEFMHQCAKVKYLVMDIVDSQQKGKVATFEVGV